MKYLWKRYSSFALSFVAIGIIALIVIACPVAGSGGASVGGNCNIQTATASGRTVVTYTLDPTTDSGGEDLTSDISFQMVAVPVGNGLNFFTGEADDADATIDEPYSIAETELTYAVWNRVRSWAVDSERGSNVYDLPVGRHGGDITLCNISDSDEAARAPQHPVTCINWFDSLKFANALSEYCALTPVYLNRSAVMRTGTTVPTLSS